MRCAILSCAGLLFAAAAHADYTVTMNAIDAKGVGSELGKVIISGGADGVTFTPNLAGLPPGPHGFHVHQFANCSAKEKDGKLEPGESAGGHYDPAKTGKHEGPKGSGHGGDLPVLEVDAQGKATRPVVATKLKLKDLENKSLMIHEGGDNFSDTPKPNGGGGTRIACGVIMKGEK